MKVLIKHFQTNEATASLGIVVLREDGKIQATC